MEQLNNRDFGTVFIGSENLGLAMVESGWAKVNRQGTEKAYNFEELEKAETTAQNKGIGVWNVDPEIKDSSIRSLPQEAITPDELFATVGKGGEIDGIVEQVLNGSLLRICLLPEYHNMLIAVAGVQSPSINKRGPDGSTKPEPFAPRAKFFTECEVLNREVKLKLQGVDDRFQNLFAIVNYRTIDGTEKDLGKELITASFAKTVEWSLSLMSQGVQELHALEKAAKEAQTGIWTGYVAPASLQDKLSDKFTGTVVEISSGDCLIILDDRTSTEHRVQLSSIRAPRMGTKDRLPEDWAIDSKEFLRRLAIGKKVEVQMEYNRKIPTSASGLVLRFGNITFKNEKNEEINIAETVVENGFATVSRHRTDDERSQIFDRLTAAEETAKTAKRNVHSGKEAPVYRLNDFTGTNAKKAKDRFEPLKRLGKIRGVVEAVMSGHRVKILLGKERVLVAFALSGIKSPQRPQPARGGQKETKGEPFAEEAMQFTRYHVLQREVTIQLEACDKMGTFLGTLFFSEARPMNLGLALLERGLASLHFTFDESRPGGKALVQAEQIAKEKKIGIWENYTPPAQDAEDENVAGPSNRRKDSGPMKVAVSHIEDGQCFYIQKVNETKISSITEQLKAMSPADRPSTGVLPARGSFCLGQFSQDNEWYRGYVVSIQANLADVYFIDYGNSERLPADRIRPIDSDLSEIPPQAHPCELAYLKVPPFEHEIGYDAARMLDTLVGEGLVCDANVVSKMSKSSAWGGGGGSKDPRNTNPKLSVILTRSGDNLSVNAQLLEAGFAKLPNLDMIRNKFVREGVLSLKDHEQVARKAHKGLFIYGDPGDSDEEDLPPR